MPCAAYHTIKADWKVGVGLGDEDEGGGFWTNTGALAVGEYCTIHEYESSRPNR